MMMLSKPFMLAANAGATKVRFTLFDGQYLEKNNCNIQERGVLFSDSLPGFNYVVSRETGLKKLLEGLSISIKNYFDKEIHNIHPMPELLYGGLAVPGAGRKAIRLKFLSDFKKVLVSGNFKLFARTSWYVFHDGESALWGAFNDGIGIVVSSGTGSIAFGCNERGEIARAGGWGHIIGDQGSGYWIAVRALSHVMQVYDNNEQVSILSKTIMKTLGVEQPEEIVDWVHTHEGEKEKIAALAVHVSHAALMGDKTAVLILREAGREISKIVLCILSKLKFKKPPKIGLTGSVLLQSIIVQNTCIEMVRQHYPKITMFTVDTPPEIGAARYLCHSVQNNISADL